MRNDQVRRTDLMETTQTFAAGNRVEWNPTEGRWEPATVQAVEGNQARIALDDGEVLTVETRHLRQNRGGDKRPMTEGEMRALLAEAAEALTKVGKAAIVVQPTL